MCKGRKDETRQKGSGVHPVWLMRCGGDNPYVDRKRRREGKENEICWSADATSGRGQKAYPFSHLEKGVHPLKSS